MRRLVLLTLLLVAPAALAAPPTGKRSARPRPTHVVLSDTSLDTAAGQIALPAGTEVAAPARLPPRGKVKVTLAGPVEVSGTLDPAALGRRADRDVELRTSDGKQVIGKARAGALLRPLAGKAPAGFALVTVAGPVDVTAAVPADALTARPVPFVYQEEWSHRTARPTRLLAAADAKAPEVAKLAKAVRVVGIEQLGDRARVRTWGGVELDGWVPLADLEPRQAEPAPAAREKPVVPTHEIFVDASLYAVAAGKRPLGRLRGGVLVRASDVKGKLTRVETRGPVRASGWVRTAALRKVEEGIWTEE